MQINTVGDALAALQQAQNDIGATQASITSAYNSQGLFAVISGSAISAGVEQSSLALLGSLDDFLLSILNSLGGADSDPLAQPQAQAMQSLQSQIIAARSTIGQVISQVDWTFGDFLADVGTTAVNVGSQAVAAVAAATGISWTWVKIGGAVLGAVVLYAVFVRVSGK